MTTRVRTSLALSLLTSYPGGVLAVQAPKVIEANSVRLDPVPSIPLSTDTPRVTPSLSAPMVLEGAPQTETAIGENLEKLLRSNPSLFHLPKTIFLRMDSVKVISAPTGLTSTAYARWVQHADLDVADTQMVVFLRILADRTLIESVEGRLFPAVVKLPEPLMPVDQARQRVVRRLGKRVPSETVVHEGSKIRWIQGAWHTTQEFQVKKGSIYAAVCGDGKTFFWDSRIFTNQSGDGSRGPQ